MKKIKTQQFIGRQLSRLKAGQSFYTIIIQTITALGIIKIALPEIDFWTLMVLFPVAISGAFMIGYFMDKGNVVTADHMKTLEMYHRYLSVADLKVFEFGLLQMDTMFEWFKSLQENKSLDADILKKKWKEYLIKWTPKEKNT